MNDLNALQQLERRQAVIRDRVRGVALGHTTGFYLFGRPGTSKTYTVRKTLDALGTPYHYHDGHLTPMGLFDLLDEQYDRVTVLDDVSAIFQQPVALQLLLAALGNQPNHSGERIVRYRRQGHEHTIHFTGGIIAISNLELHSAPVLEALKSRVHYLNYSPSDEQIGAMMLHVSSLGWPAAIPAMSPEECAEVATYLIAESRRLDVRLDMRLLVDKAFPDYLQWRMGQTEVHWKDLVTTTLEERLVDLVHTQPAAAPSRRQRKEAEHELVKEILAQHSTAKDRLAAWQEKTSRSERAFYRRLGELGPVTQ